MHAGHRPVVTLSYRGTAFSRVKQKSRSALEQAQRAGRLRVELASMVQSITADQVRLQTAASVLALRNDAVIVCTGGLLPTPLLQAAGIRFETKYGTA